MNCAPSNIPYEIPPPIVQENVDISLWQKYKYKVLAAVTAAFLIEYFGLNPYTVPEYVEQMPVIFIPTEEFVQVGEWVVLDLGGNTFPPAF